MTRTAIFAAWTANQQVTRDAYHRSSKCAHPDCGGWPAPYRRLCAYHANEIRRTRP